MLTYELHMCQDMNIGICMYQIQFITFIQLKFYVHFFQILKKCDD